MGPDGGLLRHEAPDKTWQPVLKQEKLFIGEPLVGLLGGTIESNNGAVRLVLNSDFDRNTPLPILEPAIRLNTTPGYDLSFTLDRGRVDLINLKKEGVARVRIHLFDHSFDATLEKPGARLALIVFGLWAKGSRFTTKPHTGDGPIIDVIALAIQGDTFLQGPRNGYRLSSPPGPALIHASNREGEDQSPPSMLQELPPGPFLKRSLGIGARSF